MNISLIIIMVCSTLTVLFFIQFGIGLQWKRSCSKKKFASVLLIVWFSSVFLGGNSATLEDANNVRAVRGVVLSALFIISVFGMLRHISCFSRAGAGAMWMLLYAVFGLISSYYSPDLILSLWKSFEVLVFVMIGIYFTRFITDIEDIKWINNIISIIMLYLVFSVLFSVLISPADAIPKMGVARGMMAFAANGLFPVINANSVTQFAAFLISLSLVYILNNKKFDLISLSTFLVGILVLLLGHSRTSILAVILSVLVILFFGRYFVVTGIIMLVGAIGAFWGLASLSKEYFYRGQSEEVFVSMSGRTNYWEAAWDVFLQSPIIGHGFYSQRVILGWSSVDNTYLQVLVTMGVVGLLIFLMPIFKITLQLIKTIPTKSTKADSQLVWLQLVSIYLLIMVRSLTGPTFQDFHSNLCLMMLLIVCVNSYVKLEVKNKNSN